MQRDSIIQEGTVVQGSIRHGRRVEVHGYIEGDIAAETLLIGRTGRVFGRVKADNATIDGQIQGNVTIKSLIAINATGSVQGEVRYGQMAMAPGATLSAEVRNVPPALAGDFQLEVARGGTTVVTVRDLAAYDPDDRASDLTFTISGASNGWVANATAPTAALERFSQADIDASRIVFVHDGSPATRAAFEVAVTDKSGASSGAPRTVNVDVQNAP